jgi:hypothetical protein
MQDINKAYGRVTSNDVKYRFVIDINHLNKSFFYLVSKTASKAQMLFFLI